MVLSPPSIQVQSWEQKPQKCDKYDFGRLYTAVVLLLYYRGRNR